ncbi:DNA replication/repair protein RecF [Pararhizobium haloflavum]|uniref:DNA replication/repair protein RecF n=1 Tax=Pararhizobium haloflavum TaxID=2037914 RepID=UPI000C18B84F|nr:DNA replication/repair protein RecF [Pararhizobium haloflavum]
MPECVAIKRLSLTDFRNYDTLSVAFDGRHVVLAGENGAGKTNLLEAISFLSPGRGLRRASYGEAVRKGAPDGFTIFAEIEGLAGPARIGTTAGGAAEGGQRRVRINGGPVKANEELLDYLRVLWLTPAMDGLFTGPAGDRRRFLDRMVLAVDPEHARRTIDYERAMKGRNRLLSEGRLDPVWLDGLETQMAELGIAILAARRDFVGMLRSLAARTSDEEGPFPRAAVALAGFFDEEELAPAVDLENRFMDLLGAERRRDQAAGRTLTGPHRQDLIVLHEAKAMPAASSSTGEQKALLTGLILAHARLVREMTGAAPILLLDEIAAHLDAGRRAALFDLIDTLGGQAFMTGTDAAMFSALEGRAQFFSVTGGSIAEAGTP